MAAARTAGVPTGAAVECRSPVLVSRPRLPQAGRVGGTFLPGQCGAPSKGAAYACVVPTTSVVAVHPVPASPTSNPHTHCAPDSTTARSHTVSFFWLIAAVFASLIVAGCGTVGPVRKPTPLSRGSASPVRSPTGTVSPSRWRSAVQSWYGTPYRYGGTDRRGIDCSAFTSQLYKSVAGVTLPRTASSQFGVGISVARTALRPGDLVFFSEPGRGIIHVGISLGGDEFGHASVQRGVTITSLCEPWYAARWCGAKRVLK